VNKESRNAEKEYRYLEKVTSDIYGPFRPETYNKFRYFITFLDKATRYLKGKLLHTKDQAYKSFVKYKNQAENNPEGYKISIFTTNNGGEFINKRFQDLFKK